jgi:hypothetical protein
MTLCSPGPGSRRCASGALAARRPHLQQQRGPLVPLPSQRALLAARPTPAAAPPNPWDAFSGQAMACSSGRARRLSGAAASTSGDVSNLSGPAATALAAAALAVAGPHRRAALRSIHIARAGGKDGGKSGGGGGSGGAGKGGTKPGKGAADDKADPNKADFSAYWSLRFREFFSGRRQYLELARKRQEPPEALQKVDAQIQQQLGRLEAATQAKRCGGGARRRGPGAGRGPFTLAREGRPASALARGRGCARLLCAEGCTRRPHRRRLPTCAAVAPSSRPLLPPPPLLKTGCLPALQPTQHPLVQGRRAR